MTYFARGFTNAIIISLAVLVGTALIWANYAMLTATPTQASNAYHMVGSERQNATWQGIFLNNLRASWYIFIPAFGPALFFVPWYNTATIIGFECAYKHVNASIIVLVTFALVPLEILAYIFAFSESFYVTYLAVRKLGAGERIRKQSWKTVTIYVVLLLGSAIAEAFLISIGL
jgi:hypothetical protein